MSVTGGAVLVDLLGTLAPYLTDVVFVGGWVQALYVFELEGTDARVIRTSDIDLTVSSRLEAGDRPPLVTLLRNGGFDVEAFDDESGLEIWKDSVDVDLLTEAPDPRKTVEIEGQSGLRVFGYPHQALLRENTRSMMVGPEIDESLTTHIEILVPTLPAYVTGKLLSSPRRSHRTKQAKDLAYISELMAREQLQQLITEDLPPLLRRYPTEGDLAEHSLRSALSDSRLLGDVAVQVIESSGFEVADDTPVRAQITARLSRLLAEGWS